MPDTFTELDLERPGVVVWDERSPGPHKPPIPRRDDLEVLAALHELRFLFTSQIGRRFMSGRAERSVRQRLAAMFKAGWLRRCEITSRKGGHNQRVWTLDEGGYELIQANRGRTELARHVDPEARWRRPEVGDPRLILHDLHAAAWLFAMERLLAPNVLRGWRGPRAARIDPPGERVRGRWVQMTLDTVPLGTGQHVADLALEEFQPVKPDLAVELDLSLGDERRRVDLLVELDRTGRASSNLEKFRRYDALITAWGMSHPRYGPKGLGEPPVVVFVVEDDDKAQQFLRAADRVVTGRLGKWGRPEASWAAYGRRRIFVASEIDAHQGTLRALRLPEHPPALRRALRGLRGATLRPEQVPSVVPAAFLKR